jgi:hypothetical protein
LRSTRTDRTSALPGSYFRVEPVRLGRVLCCAACWIALALSVSVPAVAQQPGPLVVVISSSPEAPFVRRLAAELSLFGYRVEVATREPSDTDLFDILARSGGAALISVDQGGQTAEVVVGERAGAGPARRERERLDPRRRADTNAAVLAERFRARLTELGIAPGPASDAPPPVIVAEVALPPPEPEEPERRLWLGTALGATSGGLGVMPDLQLEVRAFPVSWLSTSAFGKLSPIAAEVSAPEGEADVRLLAGGVLIDAYPVRREVIVKLGVGAMLVSASMAGEASAPWGGRKDSVLVAAAMFETGTALRLSPRVTAELRGFVGACSPRVAVRFAGRTVADFGQPFFGASLGLAVGVF